MHSLVRVKNFLPTTNCACSSRKQNMAIGKVASLSVRLVNKTVTGVRHKRTAWGLTRVNALPSVLFFKVT